MTIQTLHHSQPNATSFDALPHGRAARSRLLTPLVVLALLHGAAGSAHAWDLAVPVAPAALSVASIAAAPVAIRSTPMVPPPPPAMVLQQQPVFVAPCRDDFVTWSDGSVHRVRRCP